MHATCPANPIIDLIVLIIDLFVENTNYDGSSFLHPPVISSLFGPLVFCSQHILSLTLGRIQTTGKTKTN
jgi:hypothetical protein